MSNLDFLNDTNENNQLKGDNIMNKKENKIKGNFIIRKKATFI